MIVHSSEGYCFFRDAAMTSVVLSRGAEECSKYCRVVLSDAMLNEWCCLYLMQTEPLVARGEQVLEAFFQVSWDEVMWMAG